MNKILKQLKLELKAQDLLTDKEQARHEHILNTFEHIAEQNTHKTLNYVITIAAEELNMTREALLEVLDQHYNTEEEDD